MFWRKKKEQQVDNPYIREIKGCKRISVKGLPTKKGCADEVVPMIYDFCDQLLLANIDWEESQGWHLALLSEIAKGVSLSTQKGEKLSEKDLESIREIFSELKLIKAEVLQYDIEDRVATGEVYQKIGCLERLVTKNVMRIEKGKHTRKDVYIKIFNEYANLLTAIQIINKNWTKLRKKGFNIEKFIQAVYIPKKPMTEEEKIKKFIELADI